MFLLFSFPLFCPVLSQLRLSRSSSTPEKWAPQCGDWPSLRTCSVPRVRAPLWAITRARPHSGALVWRQPGFPSFEVGAAPALGAQVHLVVSRWCQPGFRWFRPLGYFYRRFWRPQIEQCRRNFRRRLHAQSTLGSLCLTLSDPRVATYPWLWDMCVFRHPAMSDSETLRHARRTTLLLLFDQLNLCCFSERSGGTCFCYPLTTIHYPLICPPHRRRPFGGAPERPPFPPATHFLSPMSSYGVSAANGVEGPLPSRQSGRRHPLRASRT